MLYQQKPSSLTFIQHKRLQEIFKQEPKLMNQAEFLSARGRNRIALKQQNHITCIHRKPVAIS